MRATKKRGRITCQRGNAVKRRFEKKLRAQAEALLPRSKKVRSFEQIYEQLARLRSWEARDLRKTLASYFSLR